MNPVRDEQQLCELLGIAFTDAAARRHHGRCSTSRASSSPAPGSGKTSVMAARVVWLVGHLGVPPEQVLGLTFTNKAAAELGQRIRASLQLLGADADGRAHHVHVPRVRRLPHHRARAAAGRRA